MFDHAGMNARYSQMTSARVFPPIPMHPCAGDVRFYERTAHIQDSGRRFAVAVSLRSAMWAAINEPVAGGDIWFKPELSE